MLLVKLICLCFNNSVASGRINVSFKKRITVAEQNLQKTGTLSKQQPSGQLDSIAESFSYLQNTTVAEDHEFAHIFQFLHCCCFCFLDTKQRGERQITKLERFLLLLSLVLLAEDATGLFGKCLSAT